jgi:hypothetical protein
LLAVELELSGDAKNKRIRLIWAVLLLIGFPVAIGLPFINTLIIRHVSLETPVSFDFTAALLSASSILFGFTSLIIISKEWVERKIWAVIIPPLALIILSGVEIGNLALGLENPVSALLISSAAFNANVVSTGLVVGYVVQRLNQLQKEKGSLQKQSP